MEKREKELAVFLMAQLVKTFILPHLINKRLKFYKILTSQLKALFAPCNRLLA
jgi:hypothetical protein